MKRAVVDQSGFKIIFFGLIISVIFGLAIKSQISQKKIKSKFDQAIIKLQPDVRIDFKSVQIKLSDWGWPQPYLEVHDIRISPVKNICDESQVFIETLSFPLTWNLLFESKKIIKSIQISQLEIRATEFKSCFSTTQVTTEEALGNSLTQIFSAHNAEQLRELKIDRIKILSKDNYTVPINLQAAVFEFSYANQMISKISLRSKIIIHKDSQKQTLRLKSDINLSLIKINDKELVAEGNLTGRIIDREYRVDLNYDHNSNQLKFKLNTSKVSLRSVFKFFDFESNLIDEKIKNELKVFFLTINGHGEYSLNNNSFENINIDQLALESETGSVVAENIQFTKFEPLEIKPTVVDIQKLDLTAFFQQQFSDTIFKGRLVSGGQLSGQLHISSADTYGLSGVVEGIIYNLNSINEKWPQKINKTHLNYEVSQYVKKMTLDNLIMNDQPVQGVIVLNKFNPKSESELSLDLTGRLVTKEFINNFLGTEQIPDVTLRYRSKLTEGKENDSFDLQSKELNYFGLLFENSRITLKNEIINLKSTKISRDTESLKSNSKSNNEFVKFFIERLDLNNVVASGIFENNSILLNIEDNAVKKSKKIKLSLDFVTNKFELLN